MPPAIRKPDVTSNRMLIAAVCQPLATSAPNTLRFAASSSR
jgi:hypothetical protein